MIFFANLVSSVESEKKNNGLIPARYSSLKMFFMTIRLQCIVSTIAKNTIDNQAIIFGDRGQWYYSIDGKNIHAIPVKSNTEIAAEICKALHAFNAQSIQKFSRLGYMDRG